MKLNFKEAIKNYKIRLIVASALLALLILSFFFSKNIENFLHLNNDGFENQVLADDMKSLNFSVNYIDVGQGNSTYIKFPDGKVLLIDGGNIEYGEKVAKTLKDDGVFKIDFMIATHADADHIAGLNFILKEFDVKNIYRPFQIAGTGTNADDFIVYEDEDLNNVYKFLQESTSNRSKISRITSDVYKTFITNIYTETYEEDGFYYSSKVTVFYDGLKIEGENYSFEFFAPLVRDEMINLKDYSNTNGYATIGYGTNNSNDNSAITLVTIFNNTFLFTGDASWTNNLYDNEASENHAETDFVNSLTDDEKERLKNVSVFLLGHHGSRFSSGEELLEIVDAKYFVVSVDNENSYDHPAEVTLARVYAYKKSNDFLLMTKDYGTITFGNIDEKLVYSLENFEITKDVIISWWLLGSIIYIFVVFIIFSIKIEDSNDQKH